MNSSDVNRLFSCFAESRFGVMRDSTFKAFIFSLRNSEGLPPFKCFAKDKGVVIYKSSSYGPSFGTTVTPFLYIGRKRSKARIVDTYSATMEVNNKASVLAGTSEFFFPDNYEVFYLA